MSNPHTADLATRYRYRQEGRELERENIIRLLEDLKSRMGAMTIDGYKARSEVIPMWIKGVEIAIQTIEEGAYENEPS